MTDRFSCPYTADELRRIQSTLRRRFAIGSQSNLIDVGFGVAQSAGRLRPDRGLCATFFVHEKKPGVSATERIPRSVRVRLKRGRRFCVVELPTDVVETAPLALTALRLETYHQRLTAGVLLTWDNPEKGDRSWGLATAGHAFPPLESMSAIDRQVTVELPGALLAGTVIGRSSRAGRIDAAIVEVRRGDLLQAGLIDSAAAREPVVPRPFFELASELNQLGRTLRVDGPHDFRVHAYLPSLRAPGLGLLEHIVSAVAAESGVFEPGSSGAAWEIAGEPSCMQLAGRVPLFQQGFGQALETIIAWADGHLAHRNLAKPETVQIAAIV